jgi:hypothetical protein
MRLRVVVLAVLMLLSLSCASSKKTELILIAEQDIYHNEKGDICMSPYYFEEILQAKIKNK